MEPFLSKQKVRKFRGNGSFRRKTVPLRNIHLFTQVRRYTLSQYQIWYSSDSNNFSESSKKSQISKLQWRNLCCASSCWAHNYHLPNYSEDGSALWCHNFEWVSWCLRSGTMIELGQFNIYNHSFFKKVEIFFRYATQKYKAYCCFWYLFIQVIELKLILRYDV